VYQTVAGGNNKLFGDNKTVILAVLPDILCLFWFYGAADWGYSRAFCRNDSDYLVSNRYLPAS
jgi:hypothetical protein